MNDRRVGITSFIAIGLLILWPIAAFLGMIFWTNGLHDLHALSSIVYHEWGYLTFPIKTTSEEFWILRGILTTVFVVSTTVLIYFYIRKRKTWSILQELFNEISLALKRLVAPVRTLGKVQLLVIGACAISILLVRLYFLTTYPRHTDEIASYDMFVSESTVAITSFYPIPNNHILFNLVCRVFHSIDPSFIWTMRAPSFLFGILGSALFFLILLRSGGYFIAITTVMLFNFSSLGAFRLFAGRGYSLIFLLSGIAFFAMIRITNGNPAKPWHWSIFILANILGLYTVPTYLYAFLSISVFGILVFLYKRYWHGLLQLIYSGIVIAVATLLLYLPVVMVSGSASLIANRYVQPKLFGDALMELPDYIAGMEKQLIGIHDVPIFMILVMPVLILWVILSRRVVDRRLLILGWGCVVMILLPYLASLLQRVHPPDRVLFYKEFFLFLLFLLVMDLVLSRVRSTAAWRSIFIFLTIPYMVQQSFKVERNRKELAATVDRINIVHHYLKDANAQRVQVVGSFYEFHLFHFAKQDDLQVQYFSGPEERPDIDHVVVVHDEREEFTIDTLSYRSIHSTDEATVFSRKGS